MDITKAWTETQGKQGSVSEKNEYAINGKTYKVDGKHVVLHPTEQEQRVAAILSEKYGKAIEFIPQILYPQNIQTPDYTINGELFDLKTLTGQGKNLLYGAIAKKRRQAHNFIVDITHCPLSREELERQIADLYKSPRVGFLNKLVLIKQEKIVKVYARQQKRNRS